MRSLLAVALVVASTSAAHAGTVFYGPTPYLSSADSPFDLSGLGTTFWLEDFEDGELNTPGVWVPGLENYPGSIIGPDQGADSVDADDGVIDGYGRGHALRNFSEICSGLGCYGSVYFVFDAQSLGRYPNFVGLVATDVFVPDSRVVFVAYDPNGDELGAILVQPFGEFNMAGETNEDRFVGVHSESGVSSILVFDFPGGYLEVDHLQYGAAVPEPHGLHYLAIGAFLCISRFMFRQKGGWAE